MGLTMLITVKTVTTNYDKGTPIISVECRPWSSEIARYSLPGNITVCWWMGPNSCLKDGIITRIYHTPSDRFT